MNHTDKIIPGIPDVTKYNVRKQWFIDRIGRRIFRGPVNCTCETCVSGHRDGVVIADEFHALCLFDVENELRIRYFDRPLPI